jgi:protein-L-isoaspartate O-methyltransferase
VLDVGSGSGYLTGIFYHLITEGGADGRVVGIEHIPELVALSDDNLRRDGLGNALEGDSIKLVDGDGRQGCVCCRARESLTEWKCRLCERRLIQEITEPH